MDTCHPHLGERGEGEGRRLLWPLSLWERVRVGVPLGPLPPGGGGLGWGVPYPPNFRRSLFVEVPAGRFLPAREAFYL